MRYAAAPNGLAAFLDSGTRLAAGGAALPFTTSFTLGVWFQGRPGRLLRIPGAGGLPENVSKVLPGKLPESLVPTNLASYLPLPLPSKLLRGGGVPTKSAALLSKLPAPQIGQQHI